MRRRATLLIVVAALALGGGTARAQEPQIRAQLLRRGADLPFADSASALVAATVRQGLPGRPLVNKALEGLAKHVDETRILTVMRGLATNLTRGRDALLASGMTAPTGDLVAAAGEAFNRGMDVADVRDVVRAAPSARAAASGLVVASSLAASGIARRDAVEAVAHAYRSGRSVADVLEMPSAAAALVARGVDMTDVTRRLLEDRDLQDAARTPEGQGAVAQPPADHPGSENGGRHGGPGH